MQATTTIEKGTPVVYISGRIDSSNAHELEAALQAVTDAGTYRFVAELNGVEYMSSAAVRALVSSLKTCKSRLGNLVLANPSERAREVLEIAGMDILFKIYDSTDVALATL